MSNEEDIQLKVVPNEEPHEEAQEPPQDGERGHTLPNGFEVPFTYELWGDGLYRIEDADKLVGGRPSLMSTPAPQRRRYGLRKVAQRPIWINRYGTAVDTDDELCELAFHPAHSDKPKYMWVDRLSIASRARLLNLARNGVPVNDGNAAELVAYLDAAYNKNAASNKLPCVRIATRCGPYDVEIIDRSTRFPDNHKTMGWLLGQSGWIGPDEAKVVLDERANHQFAAGLHCGGDADEWRKYWMRYAGTQAPIDDRRRIIRWLLCSTFAPALMRILNTRTFVIHHWATTASGKTALLKLGMSAWGDPQALTMHFNRTSIAFTELFNYADGIPIAFDELQSISGRVNISNLIYTLCLERGRARATQQGGLEVETRNWRALVRTTGEEPMIGKDGSVDLGGQVNRVLQLDTPLLSDEEGASVHKWIEQGNFGWGAVKFVERLSDILAERDGKAKLMSMYGDIFKAIEAGASNTVRSRIAHLAVVAMATYLSHRVFQPEADPDALFGEAIQDALTVATVLAEEEEVQRVPVTSQALQLLRDEFHSRRNLWLDIDDSGDRRALMNRKYNGLFGVLAGDEVWLIPTAFKKLLRSAGLTEHKVCADLKRAGLLILTPKAGKDGNKVRRKLGNSRGTTYYVVSRSAFEGE